jgi:predicted dehydrogenase
MKREEKKVIPKDDVAVYTDPFSYFYDVLTDKTVIEPYSLYSLENNVRVVEILDAARKSAKEGRTVYWN